MHLTLFQLLLLCPHIIITSQLNISKIKPKAVFPSPFPSLFLLLLFLTPICINHLLFSPIPSPIPKNSIFPSHRSAFKTAEAIVSTLSLHPFPCFISQISEMRTSSILKLLNIDCYQAYFASLSISLDECLLFLSTSVAILVMLCGQGAHFCIFPSVFGMPTCSAPARTGHIFSHLIFTLHLWCWQGVASVYVSVWVVVGLLRIIQIILIIVMEMEQSRELQVEFSQEQIIWAKITGHPWWPALITALPCKRNSCFRVDFFADNTHAYVSPTKIAKYSLLRSEIDLHRHMKKGLRKAILSADQALAQRLPALTITPHPPSAVEAQQPAQKQLSEIPFIKSTHLQEEQQEHNHQTHQDQQQQQHQEQEEEEEDEEEAVVAPQYSIQQRERYVNNLLKKYQLMHINTRDTDKIKRTVRTKQGPRRKEVQILKKIPNKTKRITKVSQLNPSLVFLLSRRLNKFMKNKVDLSQEQRRTIILSLSRQIQTRHQLKLQSAIEEIGKLFKWLEISSSATIAAYYESWSSFQSQKEKPSNMTTQQ